MLVSAMQRIVEDAAALVSATGNGKGTLVLVLESRAGGAETPDLSVFLSKGSLVKSAKSYLDLIDGYRGAIAAIPQPKKAFHTPVWMQGKLIGWIFGFSSQEKEPFGRPGVVDPILQLAASEVRSALEIECLQKSLQQNNAFYQKTIHDLKTFATGFLIASELWSKPEGRKLEQLRELAVLSYTQAQHMMLALDRLAVETCGQPIEVSPERVNARELLLAACDVARALLGLPAAWAPAVKGPKKITLWCDSARMRPALAAVIAVACGFERGGQVEIGVSQLPAGIQIVIQEMGGRPAHESQPKKSNAERFPSLDMVERIVTAHRGHVRVERPKEKYIFTLWLPSGA